MMRPEEIEAVVEGWKGVYEAEGRFLRESQREEGYVQIFEVSHACPNFSVTAQSCAAVCQTLSEAVLEIKTDHQNRGAMMGASAPHPHGQVWTLS